MGLPLLLTAGVCGLPTPLQNVACLFPPGVFDDGRAGRGGMAMGWETLSGKMAVLARMLHVLYTETDDRWGGRGRGGSGRGGSGRGGQRKGGQWQAETDDWCVRGGQWQRGAATAIKTKLVADEACGRLVVHLQQRSTVQLFG